MLRNPIGCTRGLVECLGVASHFVKGSQRGDGPAVFSRVDVRVYARDAALAALLIVQRKIFRAVLAFDYIGILAGVERAVGASEKRGEKSLDGLGGLQI